MNESVAIARAQFLVLYHSAREFVFEYHNKRPLDDNVIATVKRVRDAATAILGTDDADGELTVTRDAYVDAHALHACVNQYQPEFAVARSAHVRALRAALADEDGAL